MDLHDYYNYLDGNKDLIDISMRFAKLSPLKRKTLKKLAELEYVTNTELAKSIPCAHNTISSVLCELRNEGWVESETHGRNCYWFFVWTNEKTFVSWYSIEEKKEFTK